MHLSRDCLAEPEDLALLRAVLRTGARTAEPADRATPTLQGRFGVAATASGRQGACVGRARRKTAADT